ncbi:hypothetical protein BDP27DRAFT_1368081 [Rhodocollybia butyracea]|uniref:Uncharacterized protein n=1 Tax=Rhodocollybia butyracea TaxID=206335 RepID=A0A9P5U355_9AGAR|nr:hypothetical protein BDP27DRAFT_1368081 [Rhodocollybia butyracea]
MLASNLGLSAKITRGTFKCGIIVVKEKEGTRYATFQPDIDERQIQYAASLDASDGKDDGRLPQQHQAQTNHSPSQQGRVQAGKIARSWKRALNSRRPYFKRLKAWRKAIKQLLEKLDRAGWIYVFFEGNGVFKVERTNNLRRSANYFGNNKFNLLAATELIMNRLKDRPSNLLVDVKMPGAVDVYYAISEENARKGHRNFGSNLHTSEIHFQWYLCTIPTAFPAILALGSEIVKSSASKRFFFLSLVSLLISIGACPQTPNSNSSSAERVLPHMLSPNNTRPSLCKSGPNKRTSQVPSTTLAMAGTRKELFLYPDCLGTSNSRERSWEDVAATLPLQKYILSAKPICEDELNTKTASKTLIRHAVVPFFHRLTNIFTLPVIAAIIDNLLCTGVPQHIGYCISRA